MRAMIFKVSIERSKTPLWRRVAVPEQAEFFDVSMIIPLLFQVWDHEPSRFLDGHGNTITDETSFSFMPGAKGEFFQDTPISEYVTVHDTLYFDYFSKPRWRAVIRLEGWDEDYRYENPRVLELEGNPMLNDVGDLVFGRKRGDFVTVEETTLEGLNNDLETLDLWGEETEDFLEDEEMMTLEDAEEFMEQILQMPDVPKALKREIRDMPTDDFREMMDEFLHDLAADEEWNLNDWDEEELPFMDEDLEDEILKHPLMKDEWRSLVDSLSPEQCIDFLDILDEEMNPDPEEDPPNSWEDYVLDYRVATEVFHTSKKFVVRVDRDAATHEEILKNRREGDLRFLAICLLIDDAETEKTDVLAEKIAEIIKEKPERYLSPLREECTEILTEMARNQSTTKKYSVELDTAVDIGLYYGILEVHMEMENGQKIAVIRFAEEFRHFVKCTPAKEIRKMIRKINELDDMIRSYMLLYGVLREDEWYSMYRKHWDSDDTEKEFRRMIRWRGFMASVLDSSSMIKGDEYLWLSLPGTDMYEILDCRERMAAQVDYYPYAADSIRNNMQEPLMINKEVINFSAAMQQVGIPGPDISDSIIEVIEEIAQGEDPKEVFLDLMMEYEEYFEWQKTEDVIWAYYMDMVMTVNVFGLKGYSREHWLQFVDPNISATELMELREDPDQESREETYRIMDLTTPLAELDWNVLIPLWRIQREDPMIRKEDYRAFRKKYGDIFGVLMLEVSEYINEDTEHALVLLKRAKKHAPPQDKDTLDEVISDLKEMSGSADQDPLFGEKGKIVDFGSYFSS